MPEHLRSLVVISLIAIFVFTLFKNASSTMISPSQYIRWRNTWFAIVLFAFLSNDFWIFVFLSTIYIIFVSKSVKNLFAFYIVLLFALPNMGMDIPGGGILDHLFRMTYARLLSLTILLPAYFAIKNKRENVAFGKLPSDKFLIIYILVQSLVYIRFTSLTDTMRTGFYGFLEIFLPYYLASRTFKELSQFKEVSFAFVISCFIVALIACFEFTYSWLLYYSLPQSMGADSIMGYLGRDGRLRAVSSLGQPLILGFVMLVALGFYLFIQNNIKNRTIRYLGLAIISGGLIAPLSRGPWIGISVLMLVYFAIGPSAIKRFFQLAVASAFMILLISVLPGGQRIINLLPFIGNVEVENIDYREKLFDKSVILFEQNFWFGRSDYLNAPELQDMVQGQGIIDIVNSYIAIALSSGIIGLTLFSGFFASVIIGMLKSLKKLPDKISETYQLGRSIFAIIIAMLVTIATVSSISVIPIVYWMVAGLAVAYIRMIKMQQK